MPCPFTGPKMFCAGPNFLSQPKNLTAFSASSKTFVSAQKPILLNANHFLSGTKCFWLPQYVNKSLVWHKKFVPAQNILGPVKGQGISTIKRKRNLTTNFANSNNACQITMVNQKSDKKNQGKFWITESRLFQSSRYTKWTFDDNFLNFIMSIADNAT